VRDASEGGIGLVSPVAIAPGTVRTFGLRRDGADTTVSACVRHLRTMPASDEAPARYVVGVEFVDAGRAGGRPDVEGG